MSDWFAALYFGRILRWDPLGQSRSGAERR